jgi:AraC-like DNA-binding protein
MLAQHTYHYLTVTDEMKARSLYVLGGGTTHLATGQQYPPPDHPEHHFFRWKDGRVLTEYQLVYISRGSGVLESRSSGKRSVFAGDLFILFPNEWHRYLPNKQSGWDEHWVAFKGCHAEQIIREMDITITAPVFRTQITDMLQREFVRIEEELDAEAPGYQSIVAARIELILALAVSSGQREALGANDTLQTIKRAKTFISEQIDKRVYMEDVAKELNVSYSWFRKTFRAIVGISPGEFQLQFRITRASEYLRGSSLSITDIGVLCGFDSAYYFSRIFKKKVGVSPSEYRNRSR